MAAIWTATLGACGANVRLDDPAAPPVDAGTSADAGPIDISPEYVEHQVCILEALRNGERALLNIPIGCEGGCNADRLLLLGDGTVIEQELQQYLSEWTLTPPRLCKLKDKSYFDACLAQFDESCLNMNWMSDCQEAPSFTCE